MERIEGRTAVITGGASGIGLGIAEALAAAGARLALIDADAEKVEAAAKALAEKTPTLAIALDVRDAAGFHDAARRVEAAFGPAHILCNNAGVAAGGLLTETTLERWNWAIDVNLRGVVHGLLAFVPQMLRHGEEGHIVNTASLAGLHADAGSIMYHATKYAVVGMSESLRAELAGCGIGVSVLCPGFVRTDIMKTTARSMPDRDAGPLARPETLKRAHEVARVYRTLIAGGVEPRQVGDMVVAAIRQNAAYIITEAEFRPQVEARFAEILNAFGPIDPERLKFLSERVFPEISRG